MPLHTVICCMPGYMPDDDDPYRTTNLRDARAYAASEARRWRDDGYIVKGSAAFGYVITDPEASTHHIGWVLYVSTC